MKRMLFEPMSKTWAHVIKGVKMSGRIKHILCFGDSNTWGLDGETGERLPWESRWTGILQQKLNTSEYRIIEEGLCGRTTVFEDPLREGRRGSAWLPVLLETHAQGHRMFADAVYDGLQQIAV